MITLCRCWAQPRELAISMTANATWKLPCFVIELLSILVLLPGSDLVNAPRPSGYSLQAAAVTGQAVRLFMFSSGLGGLAGKSVDFSHAAVRFGLLRPQGGRFFQIAQRIGVMRSAFALLSESEGQ